jgi:hypothetical protein
MEDMPTAGLARATGEATPSSDAPEISFVIPCLNEEASIAIVVSKAAARMAELGIDGEILVVDNGSDDDSVARATDAGATVIHEPRRGYGSAYLAGLAAARGRYVVMTDGDDTYDLGRLDEMVARLRDGADLVIGSRFDGDIQPGAMSWSHRYVGNPILTGMLNVFFGAGVADAHCGLRAVRRDALPALKLSATGMEFASEMVIKAAKRGLRVEQVPIDYRPRIGESKLRGVPDAWRHVRFMLVHSPTFLFLVPGAIAAVGGLVVLTIFAAAPSLGQPHWGLSVAIAAAIVSIVGGQVIQLGLFARTYAVLYLGEEEPGLERAWRRIRLEHGLLLGAVVVAIGVGVAAYSEFNGVSDPRVGLLGLTVVALGVGVIFGSFFLSILGLSEHAVIRRRSRA